MGGLAGVVRFDGPPVEEEEVARMLRRMAHRGPDGSQRWVEGPVGMGHLRMRTSRRPEPTQPLDDPTGRFRLVFDGRVDDRRALRHLLGPRRDSLRDDSDAELVLAAYEVLGTRALGRIVGAFALALWDERARHLVLARDALGKRPLHYAATDGGLRWATDPAAVLIDPAVRRGLDLEMLGEVLSGRITSRTDTLIAGLQRLPPAHHLVASSRGTAIERSWSWDPEHTVRYRDRREYVHHFRELLTTVVREQVDGLDSVAAELSGGVDSSSIVGVAADLHRRGDGPPVHACSLVFPGRPCDESTYIAAVEVHTGVAAHRVVPAPAGPAVYDELVAAHQAPPPPPNLVMHRQLLQHARDVGCRVVLTGQGGDEWLTGSPVALADALRRGRLPEVWRSAGADRALWGPSTRRRHLVRYGVRPLLPPALERLAARRAGLGPLPSWLTPDLIAGSRLAERTRPLPPRGPRLAAEDAARSLEDGWRAQRTETAERYLASFGLEERSPFDDRRVVELALALPAEVLRRRGAYKWVLRAAVEGLVPDEVRLRGDKADFSHVFADELASAGGAVAFEDLELHRRGWVDGSELADAYDRFLRAQRSGASFPELWPLWSAWSTDRFVRGMLSDTYPMGQQPRTDR